MKQLLILSGKGGTGKTTIASSFISLLKGQHKTCFADCDVDVPNLHLIFSEGQTILSQKTCFGKRAVINQSLCTHCGLCEQHCRFGAMKNGVVNPYLCEAAVFVNWSVRLVPARKRRSIWQKPAQEATAFLPPNMGSSPPLP